MHRMWNMKCGACSEEQNGTHLKCGLLFVAGLLVSFIPHYSPYIYVCSFSIPFLPAPICRFPVFPYSLFCLDPCPQMIQSSEQMGLIHRYVRITWPRLYEYSTFNMLLPTYWLTKLACIYWTFYSQVSIAVKPFLRLDKPFF